MHRLPSVICAVAMVIVPCVEGQQPAEQPAPLTQSGQTDTTAPAVAPYEHWSGEIFYWFTSPRPSLRGGKAAPDFENLDYPGGGKSSPGISIRFPVSHSTTLNFSGFISKGATNTTASQALDLFGTSYSAGDFLTSTYKIKSFKLSFQDLLYPFPHKENQKWRVKTLWEVQYASIATSIVAPLVPTTDSSGNTVTTTASGSRFVVYPTFGLASEYHWTKNLEVQVSGSGFAVPHHSTIGDAEGSIGYRVGSVELIVADRYFHFKTSTQNSEYFRTTLTGPYAAVRWYPDRWPVRIPFPGSKGGGATAKTEGTSASSASAQNKSTLTPGASSSGSSTSAAPDQSTYIRRISGGATLSVLGLSLIPSSSNTVASTTNANVSTAYATQGASGRIGYGVTAQLAVTDHFAVAVEGLLRRIGYQFTTTVTTTTVNVDLTTTSTSTSTHEDTRGRLIDIPAVVRFYNRGRHTPGQRFFIEGGGAFREAGSIRSSLSSTDASGIVTCCTTTPTAPAHTNAKGIVGGLGLYLTDAFGIRIIPEVRYTRWMNPIFDNLTTATKRNEIAAGFSLSF